MSSIRARERKDGTFSWQVRFRLSDGSEAAESFIDPFGAAQFQELVDKYGGETARRVLYARTRAPAEN